MDDDTNLLLGCFIFAIAAAPAGWVSHYIADYGVPDGDMIVWWTLASIVFIFAWIVSVVLVLVAVNIFGAVFLAPFGHVAAWSKKRGWRNVVKSWENDRE